MRNQMRLDLDIYSVPYLSSPGPESRGVLEAAGIDPEDWGTPPWRTRIADRIRQTVRHLAARLPPHRAPPVDDEAESLPPTRPHARSQ